MRINKFVALRSGLSRRAADAAIEQGRVRVNSSAPHPGQDITDTDVVSLDGTVLGDGPPIQTILLHKPVGYVVSRNGQGSATIYDLLPAHLHALNPVGRLDKDSSGLLLLTNDGQLAQELSHPTYQKTKIYEVVLDSPLDPSEQKRIGQIGVQLPDGVSKFGLEQMSDSRTAWRITMREGRNRQIRRTFEAVGHRVVRLHRTHFGTYQLPETLPAGGWVAVSAPRAR